ncbi:MAG: hypothetical protein ACXACC_10630 [Promethearchaeota archaeon]|jgi:hypothetical protein
MANIELLNLITTQLVQKKKMAEYNLRKEVGSEYGDPSIAMTLLREYKEVIGDIQLWNSLLDEITPPEKNEDEGDNNN